ncbi:MAG TPA: stage 0 sporulation family protein [Papillibacter sp.]|jgi:cell fate regulator YaaT (PSP1 superfamily)|nr:stage 0 sporulation family protein [Papillibacter sp.]
MTEVISVRFKNKGKVYYFDPAGLTISSGDAVIVETSKGLEYAECTWGNHEVEDHCIIPPLRPVVRIATEADKKRAEENKVREADAFVFCQKKIAEHGLDMKLVDVEFSFEGNKILFFFTSDGRVDFRELVRDLASVFKTRIELRQIGVRDEARMLGGLGICGKQFCCTQFLDEFHPVSIKMAKTQGLSLNPVKISGTCGRLMCCLKYEEEAYEEIVKKAPKADAFVETPHGKGSVISVNLLRGYAKVRLEDGIDTTLKTFTFDELEILGGKARRAEYLAAKAEGRLEEAGFIEKPKPAPPPPAPRSPGSEKPARRTASGSSSGEKPNKPAQKRHKKDNRRAKPAPKPEKKTEKKPVAAKPAAAKPAAPEAAGGDKPKKSRRSHRGGRGGRGKPRSSGAEAPQ